MQELPLCETKKKRQFRRDCLGELEHAYHNDKNNIWDVINNFSTKTHDKTSPYPDVLLSHFTEQTKATEVHYFAHSYENLAKEHLQQYYSGDHTNVPQNKLALDIINRAFTEYENERIINRLKMINLQDVITFHPSLSKDAVNRYYPISVIYLTILSGENFPKFGLRGSVPLYINQVLN